MSKGKLFVISGASGVGKSTVLEKVMEARKDLCFSVSATTRAPRPGEVDGVNYHFVSEDTFQDMILQDAFLEYDAHHSVLYGTPKQEVLSKMATANVVLDIEPNGAFNVRRLMPEATLIFVNPPSWEILEQRLRSRGDTSPEQVEIRLKRARWEMEQSRDYDYVVVNDQVDACVAEILKIMAEKAGSCD